MRVLQKITGLQDEQFRQFLGIVQIAGSDDLRAALDFIDAHRDITTAEFEPPPLAERRGNTRKFNATEYMHVWFAVELAIRREPGVQFESSRRPNIQKVCDRLVSRRNFGIPIHGTKIILKPKSGDQLRNWYNIAKKQHHPAWDQHLGAMLEKERQAKNRKNN